MNKKLITLFLIILLISYTNCTSTLTISELEDKIFKESNENNPSNEDIFIYTNIGLEYLTSLQELIIQSDSLIFEGINLSENEKDARINKLSKLDIDKIEISLMTQQEINNSITLIGVITFFVLILWILASIGDIQSK